MSNIHCSIKIIGRSKGRSIISAVAYRCRTKMKDEETGLSYNYSIKKDNVYSKIMLPEYAPKEWDRATLWREVQKKEKKSNSQLAREVEVALPRFSRETQIKMIQEYVYENFVSKGMCADINIHDKGDGNPHAHILLTMRPFNPDGSWGIKEKKDYLRDASGNRVPLIDSETGLQKIGKKNDKRWKQITVQANDWNDHSKAEEWRKAWADKCNKYFAVECPKIPGPFYDHRSYERQGTYVIPTIHEGATARKMEKMGYISDRCEINRIIEKYRNQQMDPLHNLIQAEIEKEKLEEELKKLPPEKTPEEKIRERLSQNRKTLREKKEEYQQVERWREIVKMYSSIYQEYRKKEKEEGVLLWKRYPREEYYTEHSGEIDAYRKALEELKKKGFQTIADKNPYEESIRNLEKEIEKDEGLLYEITDPLKDKSIQERIDYYKEIIKNSNYKLKKEKEEDKNIQKEEHLPQSITVDVEEEWDYEL